MRERKKGQRQRSISVCVCAGGCMGGGDRDSKWLMQPAARLSSGYDEGC